MPVHRRISPPNMRRFHKPCKMRESLLTGRKKWCIIYRMFVFGRSLPALGGSRNKTQGMQRIWCIGRVGYGSMLRYGRGSTPLGAPWQVCAVGACPTSARFGGLFPRPCAGTSQYIVRVFLRKETVDSLCRAPYVSRCFPVPPRSPGGIRHISRRSERNP